MARRIRVGSVVVAQIPLWEGMLGEVMYVRRQHRYAYGVLLWTWVGASVRHLAEEELLVLEE